MKQFLKVEKMIFLDVKMLHFFLIFAQNIDCGYTLDGSNEYPQSMFWSKNKKKIYPCKPQFYYIKVGCKGVFVTRSCFRDEMGNDGWIMTNNRRTPEHWCGW